MPPAILALTYLLFFLSGAAALVYQVVWVRSLTLVFGGSHLAVTAVLSIFMGGLALGGYVAGSRVDRLRRPLRVYGLLELGIAASALVFAALTKLYPSVYVALAQGRDDATVYLTTVRMLFAIVALIVPTALMGATLPVLSRFVSRQPEDVRTQLAFLYGFNTLGSVCGAAVAGFFLLRVYGVSATTRVAVVANVLIGVVSLVVQSRVQSTDPELPQSDSAAPDLVDSAGSAAEVGLPFRLVLWGIGVSGFCALGYEVLWTRVLTLAVGASVYGFTIILIAFLTGIAAGSEMYGGTLRLLRVADPAPRRVAAWFGVTQIAIGVTALLVTVYLRSVPVNAVRLHGLFPGTDGSFQARTWASFVLAFLYMIVPALFMGAAFPMAGDAIARHRRVIGRAVGDVLASNTVGAILGAAVSGLLLIHLLGIERSLELLTLLNVGIGMLVLASLRVRRPAVLAGAAVTVAAIALVGVSAGTPRLWNQKYFAIFRSNQPEAFRTPEMVQEAADNTDVLFYSEGIESTVSVIQIKGGEKAFITNGRVEASSHLQAQQVQYTLGHLPMLLAPHREEVLVVGLGSGMTAGATTVHPGVRRVTLVEIEPQVLGVARTFREYNHDVLDDSKLNVIFNDGRNFLLTTNRTFDVITADPIHPWFRGAGSLYSSEYFHLAAAHLRPGGIIAQWLPLYELTPEDLASVVATFQRQFPHTMMWLTHYDSVLVGSNAPFAIDEAELERRIEEPAVAADLTRVAMGSASDLLAYFVMGTEGMRRFARNGALNTDDRPHLEFSAPFSIATSSVMAQNILAIAAHRESLLPWLKPRTDPAAADLQRQYCEQQLVAGRIADPVLAMFLADRTTDPMFVAALHRLSLEHPSYAPGTFLRTEYQRRLALEPRLLQQSSFALLNDAGSIASFEVSAVLVPVSRTRASVMFVDNAAKVVYGQMYLDDYADGQRADRFANDVMGAVRATYDNEARAARARRQAAPPAASTLSAIRSVIGSKVQRVQPTS